MIYSFAYIYSQLEKTLSLVQDMTSEQRNQALSALEQFLGHNRNVPFGAGDASTSSVDVVNSQPGCIKQVSNCTDNQEFCLPVEQHEPGEQPEVQVSSHYSEVKTNQTIVTEPHQCVVPGLSENNSLTAQPLPGTTNLIQVQQADHSLETLVNQPKVVCSAINQSNQDTVNAEVGERYFVSSLGVENQLDIEHEAEPLTATKLLHRMQSEEFTVDECVPSHTGHSQSQKTVEPSDESNTADMVPQNDILPVAIQKPDSFASEARIKSTSNQGSPSQDDKDSVFGQPKLRTYSRKTRRKIKQEPREDVSLLTEVPESSVSMATRNTSRKKTEPLGSNFTQSSKVNN